jgi:hypothetical protein
MLRITQRHLELELHNVIYVVMLSNSDRIGSNGKMIDEQMDWKGCGMKQW